MVEKKMIHELFDGDANDHEDSTLTVKKLCQRKVANTNKDKLEILL